MVATDRKSDLHVDTSDGTVWLTPSSTHTLLQPESQHRFHGKANQSSPIGTGTRQHLVDTDNVERVDPHSHVEGLLTGGLDNVLVGANTGGLEGFRRQLLVLVGDKVAAEGEVIDRSLLTTEIENSNLGVGDTTVVSGFGEPVVSLVLGE